MADRKMTFGEKLRGIRILHRMTQEDLAKRVSLEKMSISKYESGKMMPSSLTLVALCNVFEVSPDYFFRESTVNITATPEFRTLGNVKLAKTDQMRISQKTEEAMGNLLEISGICAIARDFSQLESLRRTVRNSEDIEQLAMDVRDTWALGHDPIENLMEVAETNGFAIILVDGPKKFDAAVFIDDTYGPIISLKRDVPKNRQRFTLAHELGHYFIRNSERNANMRWTPETRANRFAAALLVPRDDLIKDIGENRTNISSDELCMLRDKYGISIESLLVRMVSLGIISKQLKSRLEAYDIETKSSEIEEPRLVRKLVNRAVSEGYISRRKGIDLLDGGYFGTSSLTCKNEVDS
ncbi:MAG TPA: XRE family transcriptional regulator [Methanocorpusculum sp.]|nr:XRE family transcriptional regulator [Methanocorpusculum sp.]